jgi:hypothetical protein
MLIVGCTSQDGRPAKSAWRSSREDEDMTHAYLWRGHVSDAVMQTSRFGDKPEPPSFIFSLSGLFRITYSSLSFTTTQDISADTSIL